MKNIGFIGWRGMVGSVLMDRMQAENDFSGLSPVFFSTSQAGQAGPDIGLGSQPLKDAFDTGTLAGLDAIVTCQGGDYTREVHPQLRAAGWEGYWIDAASSLRMEEDSVIILDPVNRAVIDRGIENGVKDFIGGNCTVSLMLMAVHGLFNNNWVEWISSMTYQSASGAGAENMIELIQQMGGLGRSCTPGQSALVLEQVVSRKMRGGELPQEQFGTVLAGSLIPWIDRCMDNGQTREEWKGENETHKILQGERFIPIDGQCVRVGAMRCHSQALTIKLNADVPLSDIEAAICGANEWVQLVANNKADTLAQLTPIAVSGQLHIPVGRLRKMTIGPEYLTCFTVGDQLLWGAAEPLRRMLLILAGL